MDNSTEDGKPYPEYNYEAVSDTYQMESTQNHNDTSKNYQEQDLNQFGNGHFYQEQDLNQSESYSSQLNQPQSPLLNPSNQPPSQPHFYENDLYQVEEDGYDDKDEFGLYNSNYAKQTYPNQSPKKALSVHSNMDEDVVTALPTLKSPSIPVVRRASILQVSAVANEQSSLFVKNVFGKSDHPGGLVNIIPLETQLTVDYRWEIPLDHFTNTEKVVSLPFGPRDWSWQVV
ncbi:hypothetical protein BC833DRAFT_49625 [Globomyces pollinis-pini]|nr:hypothetical protein BC833DRAFT_49625 [Globomyces pollinis-pini]